MAPKAATPEWLTRVAWSRDECAGTVWRFNTLAGVPKLYMFLFDLLVPTVVRFWPLIVTEGVFEEGHVDASNWDAIG